MYKMCKSSFLFLSLFLIFVVTTVHAQEWAKTYGGGDGDWALSIKQTTDGGYIVAGGTGYYNSGNNLFNLSTVGNVGILKLDADGNIQWQKTYGGGDHDGASSIQQTTDGGYIVAGRTKSFGVGNEDAWVLKLDADGNIQWQKAYGDNDSVDALSIKQTTDGGYIVAGDILSFPSGIEVNVDAWVLKLDINGNIQWQKTYRGIGNAFSIQQTTDGGYIVAGQTFPSVWADDTDDTTDAWVLKLDADGNIQWQKTYRGDYGDGDGDGARSIQQTSDGGYIVAGWWTNDAWVLKLKANGSIVWQKSYGGGDHDGAASSIQQTSDGGYIVAGWTESFGVVHDAWVLKLDINGNIQWQKTYGGGDHDGASSIQQTTDGGYIVAGRTKSFGVGNEDAWVLKLNANGNIPDCSAEKISDAIVKNTGTTGINASIYVSVAGTSAIDTHTTAINIDVSPTVVCFSQGNLSNSQVGYPAEPLDALPLDIPVSPTDHTITVLAGQVSIKPSLKIPSTDQNKQAQLLMYIYLPNYNSAGVLLYGPTVSLNNMVGFDSFFPKPIDLSNYPGLLADIYYGYSLPDKEIKYNAYELKITE